ncbi:MAG TPA: hypothetical protein VFW15_09840 [Thermoanaerobaculia bacterium]|nr:hypothetical protein [Thermoanaerobaculia bacterium]
MITGYNTDVKHRDRVFHIQTEDRGDQHPYVESFVYVGGEILGGKRTPYPEALRNGGDERAVRELMEQQHRTLIAAVREGSFEAPDGSLRMPAEMALGGARPTPTAGSEVREAASPQVSPRRSSETSRAAGDRTLDQVILDYLASEGSPEQIDLTFSPAPEFTSGKRVDVRLRAELAVSRRPVAGATVLIRILSSEKPIPVFQGKTGPDGSCAVAFQMPQVSSGAAAAVVRLTSSSGSTEIQYPVRRSA